MKRRLIGLGLAIVMLFSVISCSKSKDASNSKPKERWHDTIFNDYIKEDYEFSDLLDFIFCNEVTIDTISLHYSLAYPEKYGIEHFEPTYGTITIEETEESSEICDQYLNAMKEYDYNSLTQKEKLVYDILENTLESIKDANSNPYLYEALGPTTGFQAQLPVLLAEYAFYDKEDIDDYIGLLNDTSRYFGELAEFERAKSQKGYFMSDETAKNIIDQCTSFIEDPENNMLIICFDSKLESVAGLTKDQITLYKEQNREAVLGDVIPAYTLLIETLEELMGSGKNQKGLAGFDGGKDYYTALVRQKTGSSKTVEEIYKVLEDTLNARLKSMQKVSMIDITILSQFQNYSYPYNDPEEIIDYLKTEITADFPVISDVDYSVKYIHESLQDFLSPAMYLIPPLDEYNSNNIYINPNENYDAESIFPTVAHEAYPGHLYQTVYFRQTNPPLIQALLSTTGYTEGWGLYAENYSYEYAGLSKNLTKFLQDNFIAMHCLYSMSDIGIHYYGWTQSENRDFWADFNIDADTADSVYQVMVDEPCVYLPYAIGFLEFTELRDYAETELGNKFKAKEFHKFILELGPAPFEIIKKYMKEWIGEQK